MKVQCGQCPAKYAVLDERIQDKKVRIRCKRCNGTIIVDGKVNPPLVTSSPARKSARPAPSQVSSEGPAAPDREPDSRPLPRPVAHTIMGGLEAPVADRLNLARLATGTAEASATSAAADEQSALRRLQAELPAGDRGLIDPAGTSANRWRVALTKEDLRWMTTIEITEAYRAGAVKLETFVFRAGMPSWVTLLEVPEIVAALGETGEMGEVEPESPERSPQRSHSSLTPPRRQAAVRPGDFAATTPLAPHPGQDLPIAPEAPGELALEAESTYADTRRAGESSPLIEFNEDARLSLPELGPDDAESLEHAEGPEKSAAQLDDATDAAPGTGEQAVLNPAAPATRPFPAAEQAGKSNGWLWLFVAVLALAALLAVLGPRFGLKLR
jgi:predicted Zn finger-like uncharacterized protein